METPTQGIGDVTSTAKGSGARFNTGKAPLELVPLRLMADAYSACGQTESAETRALRALGEFQETHNPIHLHDVLNHLGIEDGWLECAEVFDYGRRKYAAWNWAKGMPWSVPLACAARHLKAMLDGESIDTDKPGQPGSGRPHRGHVYCNVVMLLAYQTNFTTGNDLPPKELFA
jgi:hypothetical protein